MHAEPAIHKGVGIGRPGEALVEHVLPVRIVGVAHHQVTEEPRVVEVEAGVEAVVRREVDLGGVEPVDVRVPWYE